MTTKNTMKMIEAPSPTVDSKDTRSAVPKACDRDSVGSEVWRAMAQQWYRHLDTINDQKINIIQKSQELPTKVVVEPMISQLSKDEEYPGFQKFLRHRPYIIGHGTYFQSIEEPTWEFEKPLFPIITPEGKTGPYYLPDLPTPPMGPHQPILRTFGYWYSRFRGARFLGVTNFDYEELVTYYEYKVKMYHPWESKPIGWEDYLVGVPFKDRILYLCSSIYREPRGSYFNPISRPVWDYEFVFVGNGWTPSGQRE